MKRTFLLVAGLFFYATTAHSNEYVTSDFAIACTNYLAVDEALTLFSKGHGNAAALEAIGCVRLKKGLQVVLLERYPKGAYRSLIYGNSGTFTAFLSNTSFADPSTGSRVNP